VRTYDSDVKGKPQTTRSREGDNTDAEYRGGTSRSSEEVSVMEMERRGCIIQLSEIGQPYETGGTE